MTHTESNDWTLIASQLLREAGEIRARFETVTDAEERQRLRDRYFQIDRLLDLAHQMTEASGERRQHFADQSASAPVVHPPAALESVPVQPVVQVSAVQAPHTQPPIVQSQGPQLPVMEVSAEASYVAPPPVAPTMVAPEASQSIPLAGTPEAAPAMAEPSEGQPFYFERAIENATEQALASDAVQDTTPELEDEELPTLVVEVAEAKDVTAAPAERFDSSEMEPNEEGDEHRETEGGSRSRVNVRHVRRIGPKLERQSRNRPLSKRALKARIQLGELTEAEAQSILEGAQTGGIEREAEELDSVELVPVLSTDEVAPLPEVVPELHKEFAEFPPPELPKQPAIVAIEPPVLPPVMPAVAVVPLAPEPPVETVRIVPQPAAAFVQPASVLVQPSPTWPLRRAVESVLPSTPPQTETPVSPAEPAARVAKPDPVPSIPVVAAEVAHSQPLPVEEPVGEALPFTPLSQRIKRVAPAARVVPSPAVNALQRIQARAKEEAARPTPRDVRKRVLEAGGRDRPVPDSGFGGSGASDADSPSSRSRWSSGPGERSGSGWQSRQNVAAEAVSPRVGDNRPQEGSPSSAASAGIRPKLRPGEAWTVPPAVDRTPVRETGEEISNRAPVAPPVEQARVRVVEPLAVPSVPSAPPADWGGPVMLPVARRSVESEAGAIPFGQKGDADAVFAAAQASAVEAGVLETARTKPYSAALALPATTRDTPNQYAAWMDRAGHEPYVVRRQYYLIRAYLERYGGPFTREVIVLRHLQKAESIEDFPAMKYYATLALTEVAKLVRGGSTSEIEVILLNAEETPVWEKKAQQALLALYMLVKPKRTEYEFIAEKERETSAGEPAPSDHIYYLLRAMMVKRVGALKDHMAIRRVFEHAQEEWLVWESLVAAAYEALLEVDLFNAESLTRVSPAAQA